MDVPLSYAYIFA
jgi:hypothetical protein